jgi:hypothetical protein
VGGRLTAQALQRREPQRRYPILLTLLAQSATDVLDEVVQLFDQAISARESKAAHKMRDALAERGRAREDHQALLEPPGPIRSARCSSAILFNNNRGAISCSWPGGSAIPGPPAGHSSPTTAANCCAVDVLTSSRTGLGCRAVWHPCADGRLSPW